ncbi:MRP1 protein, partial [Polypterus senegalus]
MRATIKKDIREAKRQLERNRADKATDKPKRFFQYFSSKRTDKEEVKFIRNSKDELKDTDSEIAEALNLHFSEVFTSEQVDNLRAVTGTTKEVLSVLLMQYERIRGCRSSVFLFTYWLLAVVCTLVPLRAKIQLAMYEGFSVDAVRYFAFFSHFALLLAQLLLSCFADQAPYSRDTSKVTNPCPEQDASFLSKILFYWFTGLVVKGYRKPLKADDLWSLRQDDTSEKIISDLEKVWTVECAKLLRKAENLNDNATLGSRIPEQAQLLRKLKKEQRSGFCLLKALARVFGPYFLTGTLFLVVHDVFMFSIPQVLSLLLEFVRDTDAPLWKGYFYAALIFLVSCLQSLFNHQYMYTCFTVGMRVKTALMGLVYRKSLVVCNAARRTCTVGEIVNLVSADTQKLMDFVVYFNAVWLAPIEITLCLFFLWQHLGPSALAGIATIILIFPLNGVIAKQRSKLQFACSEGMGGTVGDPSPILVTKAATSDLNVFIVTIKQEKQMKHTDVRIKIMNEILSGIKILKFYAWEKAFLERVLGYRAKELQALKKSQILYSISIASFNSSTFLIAFAMFGVYVLIDKTNVLDAQKVFVSMALINILKTPLSLLPFSMSTTMQGSVAYVPQQAWIQNATLRDNILFGREKKESWYQRVIEACALQPDLEILPAGDETEIGEKGLNLSGGQKQRVSLARAVYRKADIYLLDDPLSAVDAHVGQHIFDKVVGPKGVLRDKTRVLVTHGLSYLPQVDLVLVLMDGEIKEMGSYQDLVTRQGIFSEFIKAYVSTERKETGAPKGTRKSSLRLSVTDYMPVSRDLSREQLVSGDTDSPVLQNVEPTSEVDQADVAVDAGKLTEADRAKTGRVKLAIYMEYFKTIGLGFILPIIFLYIFQQAASLTYNYWLSMWADDPVINGTQLDTDFKLGVYGALGFAQGIAIFGTTVAISVGGIIASRHLHHDLLHNVLRSPMAFFERTPSGNLLNRFSKEVDAIDCMIPDGLKMMLGYLFKLLEICIIVLLATPIAAIVILPLGLFYGFIQSFYVATSCQLRRLESVSRSPIYTHFNETVQGASVIRAFREQPRFILQTNQRVDENQKSYFPRFVATRWLAVNLEFLGNAIVLSAAIFSVMARGTLSPGIVGLSVSHALQAAWTLENSTLAPSWPQTGTIEFKGYGLQYRKGLDWALKDITLHIQEKEKVGIVGRTGAGKSTLALGIFRILEANKGEIHIDGVNIAEIGLHELRSRITIIPQDPVLFSGSLRMNLDPFDVYSDEEIWNALDLAHLKGFVSGLSDKLNYECSEGGENLSLGQRQLVCLARALLRKTKILVLDEATAAVDLETDNLIQSTIRSQFEDCTILTIAHRLNTIMDYTRVIVMDKGHIVESDTPSNLISQRGHFYRMCREAALV